MIVSFLMKLFGDNKREIEIDTPPTPKEVEEDNAARRAAIVKRANIKGGTASLPGGLTPPTLLGG